MQTINGETLLYGIIGDPIKHSLSPLFQNQFIQQNKCNATYLPFHVAPHQLQQALEGLHASHVQGLNITVPHKEKVLFFVNANHDAMTIGAVNTLKRTQTGWDATNTDWQGFAAVLQGLHADVSTTPSLVFGAGGTSRAVIHALYKQGAQEIWLCNRSKARAENVITQLKHHYPSMQINMLDWDKNEVLQQSKHCKVVINTTSLGLNQDDIFPFQLQNQGVAIDAVYKPNGITAFTSVASKGGYTAVDGLPMLIAQGIASFYFWHEKNLISNHFSLPDKQESLQWVEQQLARKPLNLSGWRT